MKIKLVVVVILTGQSEPVHKEKTVIALPDEKVQNLHEVGLGLGSI